MRDNKVTLSNQCKCLSYRRKVMIGPLVSSGACSLFGMSFFVTQVQMQKLVATILLALTPVVAFGQDFMVGLEAAQRGDFATALQEWRPLAEAGSSTAQYNLAVMYANGEGVPQNDTEAARWYRLAAEQGSVAAQLNLGFVYEAGQGVPRDGAEAIKWYRLAAEQGSAAAQLNLGLMYDEGRDVPRDAAEAVRWYLLAAEQGNAAAQLNLGYMHRYGEGVPQDDAEAARWYRLAAEQGNAAAQSNLGLVYRNGRGVPQDDAEALRWYRLAADQGNAVAQLNIGLMYREGAGVPQDDAEAASWYRLAAEQGMPDAQSGLGFLYEQGLGVPRDDAEAMRLYGLAAEQGDAFGQARLETAGGEDAPIAVQQEVSRRAPEALSQEISIPTWMTLGSPWLAAVSIAILSLLAFIWVTMTSRRSFKAIHREIVPIKQAVEELRKAVQSQESPQPDRFQLEQGDAKPIDQQLAISISNLALAEESDGPEAAASPVVAPPLAAEDPGREPEPATKEEDTNSLLESQYLIRALNFPNDEHDTIGFEIMRRAFGDRSVQSVMAASHNILTMLSQDGIYVDDLPPSRIPAEAWRGIARRERSEVIESFEVTRDPAMLAVIKDRLHDDIEFRDGGQHLVVHFQQLLVTFEAQLTDTNFLELGETRTARAFLLLSEACAVGVSDEVNDQPQGLVDQEITD